MVCFTVSRKGNEMSTREILKQVEQEVNEAVLFREEVIHVVLCAIVAQEHAFLCGPPGCAKSYMARQIAAAAGLKFFEVMLFPGSEMEAVFGPLDFKEFCNGRFSRVSDNFLPCADLGFLDEFSRSNAMIQESVLHMLGPERQYAVDGVQKKSSIISVLAAGNRWPIDEAVSDRFLFRVPITPLSHGKVMELSTAVLRSARQVANRKALTEASEEAKQVHVSHELIEDFYSDIIEEVGKMGYLRPSDRRIRMGVKAIQAAAYLDGADTANCKHLNILRYVLWNPADDNFSEVSDAVLMRTDYDKYHIGVIEREVDDLMQSKLDVSVHVKLMNCLERLRKLSPSEERDNAIAELDSRIKKISNQILGIEE